MVPFFRPTILGILNPSVFSAAGLREGSLARLSMQLKIRQARALSTFPAFFFYLCSRWSPWKGALRLHSPPKGWTLSQCRFLQEMPFCKTPRWLQCMVSPILFTVIDSFLRLLQWLSCHTHTPHTLLREEGTKDTDKITAFKGNCICKIKLSRRAAAKVWCSYILWSSA